MTPLRQILTRIPARMGQVLALALVLTGLNAAFGTERAEARFQLCNHTSYVLKSAVAQPRAGNWNVKGWIELNPGECHVLASKLPKMDTFYVYAETHMAHPGEVLRWAGERSFCVEADEFDYTGSGACAEDSGQTRGFARTDVRADASEWTHRFREPGLEVWPLRKARIAGIQRLMRENAYFDGLVDAYMGRKTRRAAVKAKRDLGIKSPSLESAELLAALREKSVETRKNQGFRVCNATPHEVWTALAYGPGGKWSSRGWWSLKPDTCVPVIKDGLPDRFIYVFGEARTGDGWSISWTGEHPFCISDVKFEIDSSEECLERGFDRAGFLRVDTQGKDGWELVFREEDARIVDQSDDTVPAESDAP